MKTSARVSANRRNAKRSTGPRTKAGKERVARNALRHGLAAPIAAVSEFDATVARLAGLVAGADADDHRLEQARRVAEAQIDLNRVRTARQALMRGPISDPGYVPAKTAKFRVRVAAMLLKRGLRLGSPGISPWLVNLTSPRRLAESERTAAAIGDLSSELARLDRYERRALSRRKFAVRAFDALPLPRLGSR